MTRRLVLFATLLTVGASAALGQTALSELELREGVYYVTGTDEPFTGEIRGPGGTEGQLEQGRRSGKWTFYTVAGTKQFEAHYDGGVMTLAEGWHANGTRESITRYKEGARDGLAQTWDAAGHLREEQNWLENRLHGTTRTFDHNGELHVVSEYSHGEKDGTTTWYYPGGEVKWITHFTLGKRTGLWQQFDASGELAVESRWDTGRLIERVDPHAGH